LIVIVLNVAFIVVSFEVTGDICVEVFYKLSHADKGIWLFNACEMPMVAFPTFVVIPYHPDTIHDLDHGVFKPVRSVLGYGHDPGFQLRDVAVFIPFFPVYN